MQNQWERTQPNGMQHNLLRDYTAAAPTFMQRMQTESAEMSVTADEMAPFPSETPPGMAYVPFQQWEEPYDLETAFPTGTLFSVLDKPFRGGGPLG